MTDEPSGIEVKEEPLHVRLRSGSALHQNLLTRLNARQKLAETGIQGRYDEWNRVDEHCRLFVDLSRQARKGDKSSMTNKREMPFDRAIVMPVSNAILQVRTTQLMSIFTARDPIIQIEGTGPEDVKPGKLMQATINYDAAQTALPFQFHSLIQDAEKYGMGVECDTWEQEPGWVIERADPMLAPIMEQLGLPTESREWGFLREYNKIETIDPYAFWPDPRVSLSQVKDMEFIGHRCWKGYLALFERSMENGGVYFNLDKLLHTGPEARRQVRSRDRFAPQNMRMLGSIDEKDRGFHAVDCMQVKIVPRDWQLGNETRPEIWWFTWVDRNTIIRAHRSEYNHGKFGYSVAESNPDPHASSNPGTIENLDGLQRVIDWLGNSHIENSRRHLNNSMLYGAAFIEEADILNPNAAGHFRLTKFGERLIMEGRLTLDQVIKQVELTDVTRQHIQDIGFFFDMAQRMTGAADQNMGRPTTQKRTLGEIQSVLSGSSQRMSVQAVLMDAAAIAPMAMRLVSNRQQFSSKEQFYRITGDLARELGDRVLIRPQDVYGNFDYTSNTGALPPDPAQMAETWVKVMEALGKLPILLAPTPDGRQISLHEVFNETLRAAGIKNFDQFYQQMVMPPPGVVPDEEVEQGVQAGNVVPIDQMRAAA